MGYLLFPETHKQEEDFKMFACFCKLLILPCTNPVFTAGSKSWDVKALIALNPASAESIPIHEKGFKNSQIASL